MLQAPRCSALLEEACAPRASDFGARLIRTYPRNLRKSRGSESWFGEHLTTGGSMTATYGEYQVVGRRRYRGHEPGTTFEASLDRNAEARAIRRGDIQLLRLIIPAVPAEHTFPEGWLPPPETSAAPVN